MLGQQFGRHFGDAGAAVRLQPHQPLHRQAPQRLAHRTRDTPSSAESPVLRSARSPGLSLPARIWPRIFSLTTLLTGGAIGRHGYFFKPAMKAAIPASQQAMSVLAVDRPRAATEPTHWPSTKRSGKPAHEHREAALMLGEDAEGFFAGQGVLVVVRRLAMACRG